VKGGAQAAKGAPAKAKTSKKATPAKKAPKAKMAAKAKEATGPREGSKTAQVVAMLQRAKGATLTEIMEKMNWQRHTVRGFMAGAMKKAGYTVESFKPEGGERTYRINK
jgi:predicted transcriptional regulator